MAIEQLSYSAAEIDGILSQVSGDNLLINPFFQINQRGISSSSNAGYTVDGWRLMSSGHMVEVMPDKSLKVTASSSAGLGYALTQFVENYSDYEGKTVTISALIEANTTTNGIRLRWNDSAGSGVIYGTGLYHGTVTIPSGVSDLNFGIQFWDRNADNGNYFIIKGMKVELGEISTLANDVPPNIAMELEKCQRYLYSLPGERYFRVDAVFTNHMVFTVPLPNNMRTNPSLASGSATIKRPNGVTLSGFSLSYSIAANMLVVMAVKQGHGESDALIQLNDALFSAEL